MDPLVRAFEELDPSGPPAFRWLREPPVGGRVALLLGAFDPPTRAHVAVAAAARRAIGAAAFCVTRVLLAREDTLLSVPDRLRLLDGLAAEHAFGLAAASRGTYLDVARALPEGTEAVFVVGSDKLPQLEDPSFYPDGAEGVRATFAEVRFAVVPRGAEVDRDDLDVLPAGEVFEDPEVARISASEVRWRLAHGEDVAPLVPPAVADTLRGYTGSTEPG